MHLKNIFYSSKKSSIRTNMWLYWVLSKILGRDIVTYIVSRVDRRWITNHQGCLQYIKEGLITESVKAVGQSTFLITSR